MLGRKVIEISAINLTTIKVTFNKEVEEFDIVDISAENLSFSNPVIAEDKLSVLLTVEGATFKGTYEITIENIVEEITKTLTFGTVNDYYDLEFSFDAKDTDGNGLIDIEATGATTVQITAQVVDLEGNPVDTEGIIRFTTTRGGIAQPERTLQNGSASIQLTSESSQTNVVYADIVAQIIGDYYLEGLTGKTMVEFLPPGGTGESDSAVPVVKIESNQADRFYVTLAQNKANLTSAQLTTLAGAFTVTDGIKGTNLAVKKVEQVTPRVLEVWLNTELNEANHFTDNARHEVTFTPVSKVIMAGSLEFNLTDTTKQFVLSVEAPNQRTLKVKFSEAVAWKSSGAPAAAEVVYANNPSNYIINGDPLTTTTSTEFSLSADRKTVTINLTVEDALRTSDDNLEIKNIGDWAGTTDLNNRISTQRIEYDLDIDTSIPQVEIERHSPEQFLIKFNKEVTLVDSAKTLTDLHEFISVFYGDDSDNDGIRDIQFDTDSVNAGTQGIEFTALKDGVTATTSFNQILLELEEDWTEEDGTGNGMAAHWVDANPLQFIIAKNTFKSILGNKNVDIDLEVANGRDRTSPVAIDYEQDKASNGDWLDTATVYMSEPVQINGKTLPNVTPNAEQVIQNGAGKVQAGEINFEKDGKVVPGEVLSVDILDFDFVIRANDSSNTGFTALRNAFVDPADAAGTWIVSITGISDDYGNTMATQEFDFEVPEVAGPTIGKIIEVLPEVMYAEYENNSDYAGTGSGYDVIRVKFTEVMSNSGAKAVGDTANYVLNGTTLSDLGSSIRKGIAGVTEDWDGITILLPLNHLGQDANFVLTVASNLESKDGEMLVGENELNLVDTNLSAANTATSYYTAEILVDKYDFVLVSGTITDDNTNDMLDDANDVIEIEFSNVIALADIDQVSVNNTIIASAKLSLSVDNKTLIIDMQGADISYEDGDRIEVRINGQTVCVVYK